jgi:hypothetical protein
MLNAGIVEHADHTKIKCMSATMLRQKQHEGAGLTLEKLQQKVNKEYEAAGLMLHFQVPPQQEPEQAETAAKYKEQKWHICQDF